MSVTVFHAGAHQFGLLTSLMAIGSVAGALLRGRISAMFMAIGLGTTPPVGYNRS